MSNSTCPICQSSTELIGIKRGTLREQDFRLVRCLSCSLSFVSDPWTEYEKIYSQDYYRGKGADPLLDYQFELDHPDDSIRSYEWAGLLEVVSGFFSVTQTTTWLDYGSGNGGFVRYLRDTVRCEALGFEEGWIAESARGMNIPVLTAAEVAMRESCFDVITLIEVLEHVADPVAVLRDVRRLLRPGGILFLTTGNAQPVKDDLLAWPYFVPEIHISLFEPQTIEIAMLRAGLHPKPGGWHPGWEKIICFKILKNLKAQRKQFWHRFLPWWTIGRLLNFKYRLTAHPIAFRDLD